MTLLSTPVQKAEKRLNDIRADLASEQASLTADLDFDANVAKRQRIELLKHQEAAAVDAVDFAKRKAAEAAEAERKAKAESEIEAYRREAKREIPGRINKVAKLQDALATELAALDSHVERAVSINQLAREFGFPGVQDGEELFRGKPTRVIPAQFEEREILRDEFGRQPSQYREVNGVIYSHDGGRCTKRRERVQVRAERVEPGGIPGGRIAPNIRLINVRTGRPMWPVSR
jgi:hypothetical protein